MRKTHIFPHTYCEGRCSRWEARTQRLTATIIHGTLPPGEQSSTAAVAEVQTKKPCLKKRSKSGQKKNWRANMGASWGADGTFASIRRRSQNDEDGICAISQWRSQSVLAYAALIEPMKENSCFHRKTETFGNMNTLHMLDCDNIWFSFVFQVIFR